MSFDQDLAELLRDHLQGTAGLTEKRMFGGLAFLIDGHMAVSAAAERCVMRGREMDGWLRIDLDATVSEAELERWVHLGVTYARSVPLKPIR